MDSIFKSQLVITAADGPEKLGYVVIDSEIGGRSSGGLRMLPDISEDEIRCLARAMTLKYGFLGLPQGGAKAGLFGNPEASKEERRERLAAFSQVIAPLLRNRVYVPGTDMGTTNADIGYLLESVGVKVKKRELRGTDSGYYTALTVFAGVEQAAKFLDLSLSGSSVAIEGFGKVGSSVAMLMAEANARIAAISTSKGALFNSKGLDVFRLRELAMEKGSDLVDHYTNADRMDCSELLQLPIDILCPCARHNSINDNNVEQIQPKIVCPGANIPITPKAERSLFERGVLCLPDFVTNSGGVLGGTMEFASLSKDKIYGFILKYVGACIKELLLTAHRQNVLPRDIAIPLAQRRFEIMRRNAQKRNLLGRSFELGLEFYRRGMIPGSLSSWLSPTYFKRKLDGISLEVKRTAANRE